MSKFVIHNSLWAEELEQGLDDYMNGLFDSLDNEEDVPTLSGQPFCGCSTCVTREMLFYATPVIMEGQNSGAVTLEV